MIMTDSYIVVTSLRALRALQDVDDPNKLEAPGLIRVQRNGFTALMTRDDDPDEPKVFLVCKGSEPYVIPPDLHASSNAALSRMCTFIERVRTSDRHYPSNWSPYTYDDLVSYTATSGKHAQELRWICQVTPGDRPLVVFYGLYTAEQDLQSFSHESLIASDNTQTAEMGLEAFWTDAINSVEEHLARQHGEPLVELPNLRQGDRTTENFQAWNSRLTPEQLRFVDLPPERSVRLRGPAGSGKSVALALRAFQLAIKPLPDKGFRKVLVLTQSWAAAATLDEIVRGCGMGNLNNLDIFPLIDFARQTAPTEYSQEPGYSFIAEDGTDAVREQLAEIDNALNAFTDSDWITYRDTCSDEFRRRMGAENPDERAALCWDLLIEFGSVLGASHILPGPDALAQYRNLPRGHWMMQIDTESKDLEAIFAVYCSYLTRIDARGLISLDQFYADFLDYLHSNIWRRTRKAQGYDAILVDEYQLYTPIERLILQNLTRDASHYPVICTASDPTQSAATYFSQMSIETASGTIDLNTGGNDEEVRLQTVHRYSPRVLKLLQHFDRSFPTLDLPDFGSGIQESGSGSKDIHRPESRCVASPAEECRTLEEILSSIPSEESKAVIALDEDRWPQLCNWAASSSWSSKLLVVDRAEDLRDLRYTAAKIPIIHVTNCAGLEIDNVIVCAFPDKMKLTGSVNQAIFLSRLYLAASRTAGRLTLIYTPNGGFLSSVLTDAEGRGLLVKQS